MAQAAGGAGAGAGAGAAVVASAGVAGGASPAPQWERSILVTGGAGFIGSHVAVRLAARYPRYRITVLDALEYCASLRNLEAATGAANFSFVKGSITSADLVSFVLRSERVDTVLHFAALTHVDNSFGDSIAFTRTNVLGTHVLLEAAKLARLRLFIHVSTDEVYGDGAAGIASAENAVLEPTNPYAASKAGAEYLVKAYQRSFALPAIITRSNNVYGPHQYPEKIIPKFIHQLTRGRPLTLHGDGSNTRNYLYVEDAAAAFDDILHYGVPGETYNMGSDNEIANVDVARALLQMLGLLPGAGASAPAPAPLPAAACAAAARTSATAPASFPPAPATLTLSERRFIRLVKDRPFNDARYPLDCGKLFALGWRERVSWADGLRRTVEWYLGHPRYWPRASDMEQALVAHPRRGHVPGEVLRGELPPVLSSEPSETDLASLVLEVAGADAASAAAGAGAVADAHSRARADSTVALAVRAVAETSCTLQEWLRSRADAVAVTIASRAAAAAHDATDAPLAAPR